MSASAMLRQKPKGREMFIQRSVHDDSVVSAGARQVDTICSVKSRDDFPLESVSQEELYKSPDISLPPVTRVDVTSLIGALQQLESVARRQCSRIAFKIKGKYCFVDLAEIVAVQAEGNYVSLRHRVNPYLLRESISSIAKKLKPYGFIRIHRSVVVNASAVEEIQSLPTGEYRLRVRGGTEYMVTRTYKNNLRDLAQLWIGAERLCS